MDRPAADGIHALHEKHSRKAPASDLVRNIPFVVFALKRQAFQPGPPASSRPPPVWKCAACRTQFSVTAGTIFSNRKRPIRDHLLAIAMFANGVKGHRALQLSRDLNCQYKTAFVLSHKLREAIEAEQRKAELTGECEVDGAYFGGRQAAQQGSRARRSAPQ